MFHSFQVVFILELVLQITAFGVLPYFADYWHYLDAIVVATSLLDIVLAILKLLSGLINVSFNINVKGELKCYQSWSTA